MISPAEESRLLSIIDEALAILKKGPREVPPSGTLTVEEFAARIHRCPDYVRRRIRAGLIRPLKIGKPYRIPVSQLPK